jgi:hypothetical protein
MSGGSRTTSARLCAAAGTRLRHVHEHAIATRQEDFFAEFSRERFETAHSSGDVVKHRLQRFCHLDFGRFLKDRAVQPCRLCALTAL